MSVAFERINGESSITIHTVTVTEDNSISCQNKGDFRFYYVNHSDDFYGILKTSALSDYLQGFIVGNNISHRLEGTYVLVGRTIVP